MKMLTLTLRFLVLLLAFCAGPSLSLSAVDSEATATAVAAAKSAEKVGQHLLLQGEVAEYRSPPSDRAPHSLMLQDATGKIRVPIWKDVWEKIAFREELTRPGTPVTVYVKIAMYRGGVEGHVRTAADIRQGHATPDAGAPITWGSNLAAAQAEAAQKGRKIVVFFELPEAEICKFLNDKVFADSRVRSAMKDRYVPVRINMTEQHQLASRLGVFKGGTVVLYQADGTALKQLGNVRTVDDLLRELK